MLPKGVASRKRHGAREYGTPLLYNPTSGFAPVSAVTNLAEQIFEMPRQIASSIDMTVAVLPTIGVELSTVNAIGS